MRALLLALVAALIPAAAAAQSFDFPPPDLSGLMTTASASATIAQLQATDATIQTHLPAFLTPVTLAQSSLLSIQVAGVQSFTVSTNCQVGDRIILVPASAQTPAGYMLGDAYCSATGTMVAKLFTPQLGIGASYSISVQPIAFR